MGNNDEMKRPTGPLPRIDVDREIDLGDTTIDGERVQTDNPNHKTRLTEALPEGDNPLVKKTLSADDLRRLFPGMNIRSK